MKEDDEAGGDRHLEEERRWRRLLQRNRKFLEVVEGSNGPEDLGPLNQ